MGRRAAKIAARKGKSDAIKAKLYGKYGKRIQQLVKTGGDDPTKNIALADLIDEAKSARVPRDIIDRNIGEPTAYSALHLAARAPVSRTPDTHASSHPRGGGPPRGPQSGPGGGPWGERPAAGGGGGPGGGSLGGATRRARPLLAGKGKDSDAEYKEVLYEAYGPGGTGFLIECLTDNVNRSAADVKSAVTKGGGKWAESGSVAFNFERKGIVVVAPGADEEQVFETAVDAGAEDILPAQDEDGEAGGFKVLCGMGELAAVRQALVGAGFEVVGDQSGLAYVPSAEVETDDDTFAACEGLLERLLDVDDVDSVWSTVEGLN